MVISWIVKDRRFRRLARDFARKFVSRCNLLAKGAISNPNRAMYQRYVYILCTHIYYICIRAAGLRRSPRALLLTGLIYRTSAARCFIISAREAAETRAGNWLCTA